MNKKQLIEYIRAEDELAKGNGEQLRHVAQSQLARLCKTSNFTAYILKVSEYPMEDDEDTEENRNANEFYDIYPVAACKSTSINTAIGTMMDKMAREAFSCETPVHTVKILGPNPIKINIEGATAHEVVLLSTSNYDTDTLTGQFIILRTASELVPESELISKVSEEIAEELDFFKDDDFDAGADFDGGESEGEFIGDDE